MVPRDCYRVRRGGGEARQKTDHAVAADGQTIWFAGLSLIGVYLLFVLADYFESPV